MHQPLASSLYDPRVESAVRAFQQERGLRADGVCTAETWSRLVEAGYHLGDRLLYRRSPMTRGDDVAELQGRLGSLGFDAGRVDGIYGDRTARAVSEFQRNVGLPADGRCGRGTLEELEKLRTRSELAAAVAGLKEEEALRRGPRQLAGARIAVAHAGDCGPVAEALRRRLWAVGATPVLLEHPDGSHLAAMANAAVVRCALALRPDPELTGARLAYYGSYRWESPAGRTLAALATAELASALHPGLATAARMSLPFLRETRMPAVSCEIGPVPELLQRSSLIADSLTEALRRWLKGDPPPVGLHCA